VFLSLELLLWLLLLLLLLLLMLGNNNSTFSAINQFYNYQNSYSSPTIAMILSLSLSPCERAPQPWQHQKATENTPTWELHCGSNRGTLTLLFNYDRQILAGSHFRPSDWIDPNGLCPVTGGILLFASSVCHR
jgi:hypothetical protein